MFLDECGFSSQPVVRKSWSRIGQTPVIALPPSRRRLSAIGAICLRPDGKLREHFQIQSRGVKADDLFWFLIELWRHYQQHPLIVVWDNWSVHGKVEKAFDRLDLTWAQFERLPPYAPELNPVEYSWSQTKYHDMANYVAPPDTEQWTCRIENSLRRTNRRKTLLRSFFAGSQLDLREFR